MSGGIFTCRQISDRQYKTNPLLLRKRGRCVFLKMLTHCAHMELQAEYKLSLTLESLLNLSQNPTIHKKDLNYCNIGSSLLKYHHKRCRPGCSDKSAPQNSQNKKHFIHKQSAKLRRNEGTSSHRC